MLQSDANDASSVAPTRGCQTTDLEDAGVRCRVLVGTGCVDGWMTVERMIAEKPLTVPFGGQPYSFRNGRGGKCR